MADQKKPTTPAPQAPSAPKVTAASTAASIPFDQFTESTLTAVMRAANAQRLGHVPIIIGVIFHPGLGGIGGYGGGTMPSCGFASTIKPFFTDCYHTHMLGEGLDLWDPAACQTNWTAIFNEVNSGNMPPADGSCPGTFDKNSFLAAFQCWKDQGFPA